MPAASFQSVVRRGDRERETEEMGRCVKNGMKSNSITMICHTSPSPLSLGEVFYRFDKTIRNTATYKRRPSSNYNSRFDGQPEPVLANEEFGVTNGG